MKEIPSNLFTMTSVKYLKAFPKGQKSLVFSQFTKFLSAVEPHLERAGIRYVRFDGPMSAKKRSETIEEFQRPIPKNADYDSSATEETDSETEEEDEPESLKRRNKGKGKGKAVPSVPTARKRKGQMIDGTGMTGGGPSVMLISLKSGSVGINLTAAQVCSGFPSLCVC